MRTDTGMSAGTSADTGAATGTTSRDSGKANQSKDDVVDSSAQPNPTSGDSSASR